MKYAYDIHIHSVLSPCSDELMTPNNILNMAYLNELDIIAVTDHNSMKQLNTIYEIAESYDFIVVPGIEIQVEGGHLLAYFEKDKYEAFDNEIEKLLTKDAPDEEQQIMDVFDMELDIYKYKLSGDINSRLMDVLNLVKEYDGVTILAHINKDSYTLKDIVQKEHLGLIDGIEIYDKADSESFFVDYPHFTGFKVYKNSDSHTITDIARRTNFIDLEEKSVKAFLEEVRKCMK